VTRYSLGRVLLRQFRADSVPHLSLTSLVLLLSALVAALPVAVQTMQSDEIGYRLASLSALQRDVTARVPDGPAVADGDTVAKVFAPTTSGLQKLRAEQSEPLRSHLTAAQYLTRTKEGSANTPIRDRDPAFQLRFVVSPDLLSRARIAEGSAPAPFREVAAGSTPIQIMMTPANATSLRWKVGEVRTIDTQLVNGVEVQLSGLFEPKSSRDRYWSLENSILVPFKELKPDETGDLRNYSTSAGVIEPSSWDALSAAYLDVTTTIRYGTSAAPISPAEAERLLPQLRRFAETSQTVAKPTARRSLTSVTFQVPQISALELAVDRNHTATALLVLVVVGPLGVAIAVIWLLTRLIVLRRQSALQLLRARGASRAQLSMTLALEALALTLPAALIGATIAALAVGLRPESLFGPAALAIAPALIMTTASVAGGIGRRERSDLSPRSRRLGRVIGEVLVLALTVVAIILLRLRGFSTSSSIGFDPLLAATPLLLGLSAAIVVLRVYPLPLLALVRRLSTGRGLVGHLGSARAVRESSGALAAVLAMVVGLAVAVFSGVLVGTAQNGVTVAAQSAVGADLRVTGKLLFPEDLAKLQKVPGIAEYTGLYQVSEPFDAVVGDEPLEVNLVVTDTAKLASVQRDLAQPILLGADMSRTVDGKVPALIADSPDLADAQREPVTVDDVRVVAVGGAARTNAISEDDDWVLIDRSQAKEFGVTIFRPDVALLRLDASADPQAVERDIRHLLGPEVRFTTPSKQAAVFQSSPASTGLQILLFVIISVVGLLCAAAIVLSLMVSAAPRERLLALLRTLGLSRRQSRGIVAWEVAPSTIVALVAGALLGLALPFITLVAVDLRPFTGGLTQPGIAIAPLPLALLVGGFALIVVVAATTAMAVGRRANIASTLRTSGEG